MKVIPPQYRILAVITTAIAVLLLFAGYKSSAVAVWSQQLVTKPPINLTAVPLSSVNKPVQITRTGSIENATLTPIAAPFSGSLSEVYVKEGQTVKAGQALFKIEASHETTSAQPAAASPAPQGNYTKALDEFNRYKKLFEIGAISKRQFEMAAAKLQAAKESSPSDSDGGSSSAAVPSVTTVTAQVGGTVTGLAASTGSTVQGGQTLLSLGSGQTLEAVISVNQNDLYLVHLGTPTAINVANQTLTGQVSGIYPKIEANQVAAFLAHIKLATNPPGLLKPGMTATVRIDTGSSAPALAVPSTAVFQDDQGRKFLYLAVNGKALLQEITTGDTLGELTELTCTLPPDSMVITSNLNELKNGAVINVVE